MITYLQDTQLRMEQAAMAQTKLIHRQEAVNQSHSLSVPDPESSVSGIWFPGSRIPNRDQCFWQNFIISKCGIKFWRGNTNLRFVYKKTVFRHIDQFLPFLTLFLKRFNVPFKRWKLFFLSRSNGYHLCQTSECQNQWSLILNPYFSELSGNFWVKKYHNYLSIG